MYPFEKHNSHWTHPAPGRTLCWPGASFRTLTAALLLVVMPASLLTQSPAAPAPTAAQSTAVQLPSNGQRRKAAKLYLKSNKLFEAGKFEAALRGYAQAAEWNPSVQEYALAATVARSHLVTELVQQAAQARMRGDEPRSRAALVRARDLAPDNPLVAQHIDQLADDRLALDPQPLYAIQPRLIGEGARLEPAPGRQDFHLHTNQQQVIQQVFKAYGIAVAMDASVRPAIARLDIDGADFETAMRTLQIVTDCFYVPLDPHRVIVAADTAENRQKFERLEMETLYLPGLSTAELTEVTNIAKNVFDIPVAVSSPSAGTITLRATQTNLDALNATLRVMLDGHSQVVLDVKMIQLAHSKGRGTGATLPQSMSVFNVYAEAQSLLTANQSLVDEIVASGLAAPGDYLTIIAILLASGQVTSSTLSSGFATFGGGAISTFGVAPGSAGFNFSLNSSDSRALDNVQLRLGDNEAGTLRSGLRYPITTSSFSNLSASAATIAGLTSAGTSSALSSLASTLSSLTKIPMFQYQELGLTLKATPKVLRNGDVALTVDMKIAALAGQSLNEVPVLANRAYSGVVTLKEGESQVIVSEIDRQESRAISGTPGLSEIPGMNNLSNKSANVNEASLLIILTPHVVRGQQLAGHTPMLRIERGAGASAASGTTPMPAPPPPTQP